MTRPRCCSPAALALTLPFLLATPAAAASVPVRAKNAMVVSQNAIASQVGMEVLLAGGNAVDAAVATAFVLAVVHPEAGNIGGGGFMLIRQASGEAFLLDYRERAPEAASRDMFLGPDGEPTDRSRIGHLAAGVPGSVAGMLEAHRRFGRLPLASLIEPAIRLARDGFILDLMRSERIRGDSAKLARFPASAQVFLPDGRVPAIGERLVQRDLARTLTAIRDKGTDGFYTGWVADSLVAEMRRGGGLITHADLAAYRAIWREPVAVAYRGHTVIGAPPASSGGITLGLMLNVLQAGGPLPPFGSADMLHLYAETMRRGFAMRNQHVADPAYYTVPMAWMLSTSVGDSLRRTIDPAQATPTPALTTPGTGSTTHYSVVDAEGMAVATTTTINDLYGCGVTVSGAGFLLNDEMDDFTIKPGVPNLFGLVQGSANAILAGKRPLSSMAPTIVTKDGRLRLVLGSPGGSRIISTVLQVIVNTLDHDMSLADALSAPRIHHQWLPDQVSAERGYPEPTLKALETRGHSVMVRVPGTSANSVLVTPKGLIGAADTRSRGALAAGVE
jgi:gamma-glutamyltranspeptidase/glutathione hydrolase